MNRIDRIKKMEKYYDNCLKANNDLYNALNNYLKVEKEYKKLLDYYESDNWIKDYEADERKELPKDLKRGVLSEDGIYNLILDKKEIIEDMLKIINSHIKES